MESNSKRESHKSTISIILAVIALIVTFVLYNTYDELLANFKFEKYQIKVADEARKTFDYGKALTYYNLIIENEDNYSSYAALAKLEIYNDINSEYKDKNDIIRCFKEAIKSKDIQILKKCLNLVLIASESKNSEDNPAENYILCNDNLENIVKLINFINELEPKYLENVKSLLPITKKQVRKYFVDGDDVMLTTYYWKYVSTITSPKSSLGHIDDNEQVLLEDMSVVCIDPLSMTMVKVYKYYKYKKVVTSEEYIKIYELLNKKSYPPTYLSDIESS